MKKIYYYFFNLFFRCCALTFHFKGAKKFWSIVIALFLVCIRYRSFVLSKNLDIAFGESLTSAQKAKFKRQVYSFLSYEICYYLSLAVSVSTKKLRNRTKIIADEETRELCKQNRPMILISGHTLGSWVGALFAVCFRHCYAYTYHGPQNNSYEIFKHFQKIADRFFFELVPQAKNDVFVMRKCLKNNHCLSIIGDLNVPHTNTFVDFFGTPVSVGEGAFRLALLFKAPIVYAHITEDKQKKLIFSLEKIYEPKKENPTVLELATRFMQKLEQKIRSEPTRYFWTNKRWKTRPAGEEKKIYTN